MLVRGIETCISGDIYVYICITGLALNLSPLRQIYDWTCP